MLADRFSSFLRWRWASSVGVVTAACVPVVAAVLLVPSEITPPWGEHAVSLRKPSPPNPRSASTTVREMERVVPPPVAPRFVSDARESAPSQTAPRSRATALETTKVRGHFVPLGETDDSRPIEPHREARP